MLGAMCQFRIGPRMAEDVISGLADVIVDQVNGRS